MVEQIYLQLTHLRLFIKHLIVIQISNVNQLDGPFNFPVQQDVFVAVCYHKEIQLEISEGKFSNITN
jgi:hypothetical protein